MYIFVLYVVNMLDMKGVRWQLHYYDNIFIYQVVPETNTTRLAQHTYFRSMG